MNGYSASGDEIRNWITSLQFTDIFEQMVTEETKILCFLFLLSRAYFCHSSRTVRRAERRLEAGFGRECMQEGGKEATVCDDREI